ncbi:hypothetical protein GQF42_03130 [Streptomyces broussonetiae]|uniref:Uncharacterized protein n=1 Tax=Streptomyces broussonetiae TaxID=2686304 RepID=A0A6I6NMJ3_9ACTN|nr:hypothetical protein GQF42_03130 [Streptomyces broussonetiae]
MLCATEDPIGLERSDIGEEYPVALLPAHHPLAGRRDISLARLRSDPAHAPERPQPAGTPRTTSRVTS